MITQLNFYEYLLFIILLICQSNFLSGNKSLEVPLTTLKLEESNPSQGSRGGNPIQGSRNGNPSQGSRSENVGVCVRAMFGPYHNVKQLGKQIIWLINSGCTVPYFNSGTPPFYEHF